jgi:hypothetical protein
MLASNKVPPTTLRLFDVRQMRTLIDRATLRLIPSEAQGRRLGRHGIERGLSDGRMPISVYSGADSISGTEARKLNCMA